MNLIRPLTLLACLSLCSPAAFAEAALQERLFAAVERQDGKAMLALLDEATRDAAKADWISLFTAAQIAAAANRFEDALFLYHAAQMRSRAELMAFPATDRSGAPALRSALKQQTGEAVNPLMIPHSQEFIAAVKRLRQWQPVFAKDYRPEWGFDAAAGMQPAVAVALVKHEHMGSLEDLAWFLGNEQYLKALRVYQAYQSASPEQQQNPKRQAEYEAAVRFMQDLEEKSGRKGFMGPR